MTATDSATAHSRIRKTVMRRARIVRAVRPLVSNLTLALVFLTVSLYLLGREVFVAQVFHNMAGVYDAAAAARFIEGAFLNTTGTVQLVTFSAFVAAIWMAYEALRAVVPTPFRTS